MEFDVGVNIGQRRQWLLREILIPKPTGTGGRDVLGVAREENGEATELLQFCCKELGNQGRRKANLAKRIERGREEIRTK